MKKILVIGPHPDDLEFGCGGALYKFSKKGFKLNLLVMTKGEVGGEPEIREREQNKSARILKANLLWGGFLDTKVEMSRELINSIESNIKKINPDLILVNYYNDTHQDHRNIAQATITAARYVNNLMFYEVPTSIDFNPSIFTDIEDVMDIKMKLLRIHNSQVDKTRVPNLSIIESAKSAAVFRGYQARVKYAEGFKAQRMLFDNLIC
jgi:LmbE family N-acetylglucosaminyl deacetylase